MGGVLFWGDVLFDGDWHIQENVLTKKYRLLDGSDRQYESGTLLDCKTLLAKIKEQNHLPAMSGSAVLLLHGFGSNTSVLDKLAAYLRQHKTHSYVLCIEYPSTMQGIADHEAMLRNIIGGLPPSVTHIDMVGHSLGSIVIRKYLSDEKTADSRIGKFVMLGPPNHGSELAERIAYMADKTIGTPAVRIFTGQSADELGTGWTETEKTLGIPCRPFMIVAGGKGDDKGYSSLITGDDDGMVSTEGTKLEGAKMWVHLPNMKHSELLQKPEVFELVRMFLR